MRKPAPTLRARTGGAKKPLTPPQVDRIGSRLHDAADFRGLALFRIAIDTMFRASDVVSLTVDDVTNHNREVMDEIRIIQHKTGKPVKAVLATETQLAIKKWLAIRPHFSGEWLFPGGRDTGKHLTASQYRRAAKEWFRAAGLDVRDYSTHSLRRTKAALIYKKTGNNIEVVRRLLGHSSVQATSRYLGIDEADALAVAREVKI